MTTDSTYRPPSSHRGYPCARCHDNTYEFYGLGDNAVCATCRDELDRELWLLDHPGGVISPEEQAQIDAHVAERNEAIAHGETDF